MLREYLGNVSPNTTLKWGDGGEILALTIGDVKIVTLVGHLSRIVASQTSPYYFRRNLIRMLG